MELTPLVDAINEYAIRLDRYTSVQQSSSRTPRTSCARR